LDKLLLTLRSFKNKKTPDPEDMNIELIKKASLSHLLKILEFLNTCWKTGFIPDEWKEAMIFPIFKKGNRIECSNYKGKSLLTPLKNICKSIIKNNK
jgi:hypothetical protein